MHVLGEVEIQKGKRSFDASLEDSRLAWESTGRYNYL